MRIQSKRVYTGNGFQPLCLVVEEGKIQSVEVYGQSIADMDYGNLRIVPGFIDVHTHGGYGSDTMDGDIQNVQYWAARLPEEGVTAFLPTTVTADEQTTIRALKAVDACMSVKGDGAEILGVHMEGPFLNPLRKGAHPEEHLRLPDVEWFSSMQEICNHRIRLVTLAPEMDQNHKFLHYCVKEGIRISAGHSAMNGNETILAYMNGVNSVTHVFNGMNPFHHRESSLLGIALIKEDLYGEVIADGCHSTIDALRLFFRAKDAHHTIVISDSLRGKGVSERIFDFAGREVKQSVEGGIRDIHDGTLAGSSLKINEALKLLVEDALIPFDTALRACTLNPAEFLGLAHRKGSLQVGKDADLVVLEDDYRVHAAYTCGILHKFI